MPKFSYKAKNKEGEQQVGVVESQTKDGAASILAAHDLFVLSLEEVHEERFYDRIFSYFGRVKRDDMVVFTRQLSTLLEARLALPDTLRTLYEQTTHKGLKAAIASIGDSIDSGLSFSQALEHHPDLFSEFFISMVRSAEVTGGLEKTAGFLADYLEKESILVQKARGAMVYPIVVIGLFVVVAGIMLIFVLPQIEPIFTQAGVDLPIFTRILLGTGHFVATWWYIVILALGGLFVAALDYMKTREGRAFADDMKVKAPILKKIYLPLTLTRLGNTMYMLLKGGVPMTQAIQIMSQTIDNVVYQEFLREIADDVRQGEYLSKAMAKYPFYFPPLISQMIAVGERTGQVDELFNRVSNFYAREADAVINNLVELIQPLLMVGIGVMVGALFAAILLPIYQLATTMQ